jgi:hypothetical protein
MNASSKVAWCPNRLRSPLTWMVSSVLGNGAASGGLSPRSDPNGWTRATLPITGMLGRLLHDGGYLASTIPRRLFMNDLTERLTVEQPIVMGGADPTVEELHERTGEMGYVLVKFTQTRGGTELGFPLDRDATDISSANFDEGSGSVHVEGHLTLNDDPVRCIADIDLGTLKGTGRLKLEEKVTAAAE